jgi:NADP-dependent 3-hydroxy acid dehydrogenase YdfG
MRVVITGASRGIGRGVAEFLAMDGFDVAALARSKELLEDLCASVESHGGRCVAESCDVCDPDQTARAIDAAADRMGGIDALINNAGIVLRKPATEISIDEWRTMVDTNLNGVFYATRAALPRFREQGHGHIINVSSISGKFPLPGGSGYAATKYAVNGFSQSLFQEVRDFGVKVTTVFPGSVDTASHRHDPGADHSWKVTPEDIGRACASVLRTPPGTLISELEIRPLSRPPKK